MLGHPPYYHKHIRRYVSLFGTLFNDISIIREDSAGNTKTIKVPLAYANKDKALARLTQDPELANTWGTSLPRMAFSMGTPQYDPSRKTNSILQAKKSVDGDWVTTQYAPAPYNISFDLSIWVQYFEDGAQIIEQILPFFQPEFTVNAKEVPALDIERDIHIVLDSVSLEDDAIGEFQQTRLIEWTLSFTLKGYFFGPVHDHGVIKRAMANTYFTPDFTDPVSQYEARVDPLTAGANDPHEIIETRSD